MVVDFNIVNNGETSSPMQRLIQEIEIIMTAEQYQIIHNAQLFVNVDSYLFKTGLNTSNISSTIKSKILNGVTNEYNYDINVEAGYLASKSANDTLLINIVITAPNNTSELLQYAVVSKAQ